MDDVPRLESIAKQFVARVHDDDPEANLRWLRAQLGIDQNLPVSDAERLLHVLAAAVPTDRTWAELVAWCDPDRRQRQWREAKARYRTGGRRAAA